MISYSAGDENTFSAAPRNATQLQMQLRGSRSRGEHLLVGKAEQLPLLLMVAITGYELITQRSDFYFFTC